MSNLQSVIVTLSVSYALIGALLLVVIVYGRLPWPAKAIAVVVNWNGGEQNLECLESLVRQGLSPA